MTTILRYLTTPFALLGALIFPKNFLMGLAVGVAAGIVFYTVALGVIIYLLVK